jgi:hypothetical protein
VALFIAGKYSPTSATDARPRTTACPLRLKLCARAESISIVLSSEIMRCTTKCYSVVKNTAPDNRTTGNCADKWHKNFARNILGLWHARDADVRPTQRLKRPTRWRSATHSVWQLHSPTTQKSLQETPKSFAPKATGKFKTCANGRLYGFTFHPSC